MSVNASNATTCRLFNGDQHLCDVIIGVKRFMASLSLIGCLAAIFVIWLFRLYYAFIRRLTLFLSIASFLKSIFFITGDMHETGSLCVFQAWGLSFFSWELLLWNSCIIFNLYMTAIKGMKTEKFEWLYHIISWGVSFIIACIPLFGNHYGPAGMWCWIVDNWAWRFGLLYLPLVLSITVMSVAYIYITVMVKRQQLLQDDLKPLRWYPLAFLLTSVFPLINRIQNAIYSEPVFALSLLHVLGSPLYGFALAIIFFTNKEIRSQMTFLNIKDAFSAHTQRQQNVIREYSTGDESTGTINPAGDSISVV